MATKKDPQKVLTTIGYLPITYGTLDTFTVDQLKEARDKSAIGSTPPFFEVLSWGLSAFSIFGGLVQCGTDSPVAGGIMVAAGYFNVARDIIRNSLRKYNAKEYDFLIAAKNENLDDCIYPQDSLAKANEVGIYVDPKVAVKPSFLVQV